MAELPLPNTTWGAAPPPPSPEALAAHINSIFNDLYGENAVKIEPLNIPNIKLKEGVWKIQRWTPDGNTTWNPLDIKGDFSVSMGILTENRADDGTIITRDEFNVIRMIKGPIVTEYFPDGKAREYNKESANMSADRNFRWFEGKTPTATYTRNGSFKIISGPSLDGGKRRSRKHKRSKRRHTSRVYRRKHKKT